MSGLIFVALFAAWAMYLIPRSLQAHDEMARTRSVQSFSNRLRTFGHGHGTGIANPAPAPLPAELAPFGAELAPIPAELAVVSSAGRGIAARKAAARRRRVLLGLVVLVAVTSGVAAAGYTPVWSVAIPASFVFGFLVVARLSVRAGQPVATPGVRSEPTPMGEDAAEPVETTVASPHSIEVAAEDDGMWDPLPLTLPTYVGKPSARRTIRSIELTAITSSGHDAEDSRIARDAEAALLMDQEPQRRVAGA